LRLVLIVLALGLGSLAAAPSAAAHATLRASEPAPNGHLDANATLVTATFTERVDRAFTTMDVVDAETGSSWAAAPPVVFGNVVSLETRPLPDGIYAASWRTLSLDGHTARGTFLFSVGQATLPVTLPPQAADPQEHSASSVLEAGFARGVALAGAFLALGAPAYVLAFGGPRGRALRVAGAFALLGAAASALELQLLARSTDLSFAQAAATFAGGAMAARAALLLAAGAALLLRGGALASAAAAGALLALAAPAASDPGALMPVAVAAAFAGLVAAALWTGGVLAHLLSGREETPARAWPWALAAALVLLASAALDAWRHVPTAAQLLGEGYGLLSLLDLALVAAGILLVAWLALARERWGGAPVAAQALVLLLLLSSSGILAQTQPPAAAIAEGAQPPGRDLVLAQATRTMHVVLDVSPSPVAANATERVTVELHSLSVEPVPNDTRVAMSFDGPGAAAAPTLERLAADEWSTEAARFDAPGGWVVTLHLERPDESADLSFTVPVTNPGG
jgi:methionine-rich copper-binding protein CopC